MQQKTFTEESKALVKLPSRVSDMMQDVDDIENVGNVIDLIFDDFINALQGVESSISRDKDLDSIMRERIAYEKQEFQENLDNFTNKITILENALDKINEDKGTFKINGTPNWAFYSNPSANYDFNKKRIEDGDGFITMVKPRKSDESKPYYCQKEGWFGRLKKCEEIEYGNSPFGRLSKIRQLNGMMDELYSAIYSLELEKTTLGKNIHALQPDSGSFAGNLVSGIGKNISKSIKNIDLI